MQSYSFMCKNTFLACVGHMLDMWDPHQSISLPQEPLFRDQDHQNWTRHTKVMYFCFTIENILEKS